MGLTYWNKVIDLYFLDENYKEIAVLKCPRFGRKPNIEITGNMFSDHSIAGFNITIKNFYLDNITSRAYAMLVVAGYAESTCVAWTGNIVYIHPQAPAPEGSVVIQCSITKSVEWLTKSITLNLDKGYTLYMALNRVSKQLGFKSPVISPRAMQLTSKESLQFQGSCQNAVERIKQSFSNVYINVVGDIIQAYMDNDIKGLAVNDIPCLSAPPQITAGVGDTMSSARIIAPWLPQLKVGDIVSFDSTCYQSTQYLKHFSQKKSKMRISNISFHFSTTGSANEMTLYGLAVNE